jgi:hypothetical protein
LDNLSIGGLGLGRADEDDRKKRMDAVVQILKARTKDARALLWERMLTCRRLRVKAW